MDQIYPKKVFPVENRTSSPRTKKAYAFCAVNVYSIILNILKISKISLFWTFWKKNWLCLASWALFILKLYIKLFKQHCMISKVMIKFRSEFQFQIPLQFYRTAEKIETCYGNGQKFWQLPPSFQPSHFGYYFHFSWLRFKHTKYKVLNQ